MRNKLTDLNDYLFEELEQLMDRDMNEAELKQELERSDAVAKVAGAIIHNGSLQLKAAKYFHEAGVEVEMPENLLSIKDKNRSY